MGNNQVELLKKLSSGLCSLKGIGEINLNSSEEIEIGFENWEWEIGVGLYGLYQYAEFANNDNLIRAIANWFDKQISNGLPEAQINTTAPMITLAILAEKYQRSDWKSVISDWADYLIHSLPRVYQSGFQHVVKERMNEGQLWDDTLFMTGLFLAKAGSLLERDELIHEAELQFISHAQYLMDNRTGLWFHGWTAKGQHNFAQVFWARGNAWITVAIPELFHLCGERLSPAVQRHLTSLYRRQVATLIQYQHENGMWHTVVDDAASPQESSAVAGIAYGMLRGCRAGLIEQHELDRTILSGKKALNAIIRRIDDNGILLEASDGTAMGHDIQYYFDIPNTPVPYGQALAMMCITESIQGKWS